MTTATRALPAAPPAVQAESRLDVLAPKLHAAILRVLAEMEALGMPCRVAETLRTPERQSYLYGFGRRYDDGRGIVTRARTNLTSWHGYGLAADLVHRDRWWNATPSFWTALGACAEKHGLSWGGRWKTPDRPHVQWPGPVTPGDTHRQLLSSGGRPAVWRAVKAA